MRLVLRVLGRELLELSTDAAPDTEPGDCTTTPVGFGPVQVPVQRWQPGDEL